MDTQCDKCKRLLKNINKHKCYQCLSCNRFFSRLHSHKCKYRQCITCKKVVKITAPHRCHKILTCSKCDFTTKEKVDMVRHRKAGHIFDCPECAFQSPVYRIIKNHYYKQHKLGNTYSCPNCSLVFNKSKNLQDHILTNHALVELPQRESAFKKACVSYGTRFNAYKYTSIDELFKKFSPQLVSILKNGISSYKTLKANITIFATLDKCDYTTNTIITRNEFIFNSKAIEVSYLSTMQDLNDLVASVESEAEEQFDSYCDLEGSGWTFEYVGGLFIQLGGCKSLTGGSNHQHNTSSDYIWDGPCERGECFYTAIARHFKLQGEDSDNSINKFAREKFEECRKKQHMNISQISKFEKKYNLGINVILKEEGDLFVVYHTKNKFDNINLLLLPVGPVEYHYVYITNIDGLVNELRYLSSNYLDRKDKLSSRKQVYTCLNCLNVFNSSELLDKHYQNCQKRDAQRIEMPQVGSTIKFSKYAARLKAPLIGAFDFESKMCKRDIQSSPNCQELSMHKIVSYSFMIVSNDNEIIFERSEMDENNCLQMFMEAVFEASAQIKEIMKKTVPMDLSKEENERFKKSTKCHICELKLDDFAKVRDHCHFTGKYIGAAHNVCNLNRKKNYKIPIYAHNFSNYDGHFLIQAITEYKKFIPNMKAMCFNSRRFRSISFDMFNFLDSLQFISDSLENITSQLVDSNWAYPILKNSDLYETETQRDLLLKKGVFPYELLQSYNSFKHMKKFPKKQDFYSTLRDKGVSNEDYLHGLQVFREFKCENMANYLQLYNKLDVILLLEAISSFRNVGWKEFGLDPAYFISLPQYGFQWYFLFII